jgi:hypothetical protein
MASLVQTDLTATLPGSWACQVQGDYVLLVRSGHSTEEVVLDQEVDEEAWPADAWSPTYRNFTLDDDASEAIASEVQEVLRSWGMLWPICRTHDVPLTACSGVWSCSDLASHDPAALGALTPDHAMSASVSE